MLPPMPSLDAVSFISPGSLGAGIEVTVASIASPTELNSRPAAQGDIILARTTEAGTGMQTWYYADTTSDAEALPWIVSSATAGVKFIAVAGAYANTANVKDSSFAICGNGDISKRLVVEVDAQTTGDTLTLSTGAQTDSRTLSVPVLTGNATLATISQAQSFTGVQTFTDTTDSTSKDTGSIVTEGGIGVEKAIYAGMSITAGTGFFSGDYSSSAGMTFRSADASAASLLFRTATNNAPRWELIKTGTAHTLNWSAYDSSGALIDTPISCLNAANGALTFARPTTISDVLKVSGAANLPAACGGALFIAGNQSGSVAGSIYIGDGTGWSFKIRSRTGSADTDRITITDAGVVTLSSTSVSSIGTSGGITIAKQARLAQIAGTTVDGDVWHDSTQKALQAYVDGIEQTLSGCIFTQTATRTIANTVTETSLFTTGVGTLTLPANFFLAGKTIRLVLTGTLADTGTPTVRLRLKYGSTTVIDSTAQTLAALTGTEEWRATCELTCRAAGASGTIAGDIWFAYDTATGTGAIQGLNIAPTTATVDTTASGAIDLTWEWGAADVANTVSCVIASVEVIN